MLGHMLERLCLAWREGQGLGREAQPVGRKGVATAGSWPGVAPLVGQPGVLPANGAMPRAMPWPEPQPPPG